MFSFFWIACNWFRISTKKKRIWESWMKYGQAHRKRFSFLLTEKLCRNAWIYFAKAFSMKSILKCSCKIINVLPSYYCTWGNCVKQKNAKIAHFIIAMTVCVDCFAEKYILFSFVFFFVLLFFLFFKHLFFLHRHFIQFLNLKIHFNP